MTAAVLQGCCSSLLKWAEVGKEGVVVGGVGGRREEGGGRSGKKMIREERDEGGERKEVGELCMWGKGGRNHIKITFASLRINKFSLHKMQHFKRN
jgi:hypothetical protein